MCISVRERVRNEVVKQSMDIGEKIIENTKTKELTWYGHVQQMPASRLLKQVLEWQSIGRRKRGRPKT